MKNIVLKLEGVTVLETDPNQSETETIELDIDDAPALIHRVTNIVRSRAVSGKVTMPSWNLLTAPLKQVHAKYPRDGR